jgi:hypothetical protein
MKRIALGLVGGVAVLALTGFAVPDDVSRLWGGQGRPLLVRRLDLNLDGSRDLLAVVQYKGAIFVSAACHYPDRPWPTWERCGGFGVAVLPEGAPRPTVHRLQTGDMDGDERADLAAELVTADGVHHLALGPLLHADGYGGEPGLHLRAREFLLWDANGDGRVEVTARELEGPAEPPAFVTFTADHGGWRRSHGMGPLPPAAALPWRPALRVPDVRGEPLESAVRLLAGAGLRPGMVVLGDMGGRGFRDVTALNPPAGTWARGGSRVKVGVAVPVRHGQVTDWGEVERVMIHGVGGLQAEVRAGAPALGWLRADLFKVLATADRAVRVGGPPFSGAYGPFHYYAPTLVEFQFRTPLVVQFMPQRRSIAVQQVAVPFTRYEQGLVFLGTPAYREALICSGGLGELADHIREGFFPAPPRE